MGWMRNESLPNRHQHYVEAYCTDLEADVHMERKD